MKKLIKHIKESKIPDSNLNNSYRPSVTTPIVQQITPPKQQIQPIIQPQAATPRTQTQATPLHKVLSSQPDIIDVTPNKPQPQKTAIRIQTDFDPLLSQRQQQHQLPDYDTDIHSIPNKTPQKAQTKYEFKLLTDENTTIPTTTTTSQPIISSRTRMRQATYISDQIDRAREEELKQQLQQQQQAQHQQQINKNISSGSPSSNLRSYLILASIILGAFLFYYFFGSGSNSSDDDYDI